MNRDVGDMATGGAYALAPVWMSWVDPVSQAVVSVLGIAVLVLTIWVKVLEVKMRRAQSQNHLNEKSL